MADDDVFLMPMNGSGKGENCIVAIGPSHNTARPVSPERLRKIKEYWEKVAKWRGEAVHQTHGSKPHQIKEL